MNKVVFILSEQNVLYLRALIAFVYENKQYAPDGQKKFISKLMHQLYRQEYVVKHSKTLPYVKFINNDEIWK